MQGITLGRGHSLHDGQTSLAIWLGRGFPRCSPVSGSTLAASLPYLKREEERDMLLLLLVIIVLLFASAPAWPYSRGWGYYPSGGLGTILLILIVLMLFGYVHL